MKKLLFLAAIAASVLASCAKVENTQKNTGQGTPVTFGVYNGRMGTKAVSATTFGQINTTALLQASAGFGVFAYYSDGATNAYNGSNFTPNFMYNQLVEYDTDHWTYAPVKYWPNEYNTTDAIGADVDKLTFFAYAPYVASVGDEGITAFSAKNATNADPTLTFKVPASQANQIDLLWSDAATVNLTKYAVTGTVDFTFKHALSNLTILPMAVVDHVTTIPSSGGTDVAANTLVKINSITVNGKFNQQGTLNLATGVWTSSPAASAQDVSWTPETPFDVTAYNDKAEINTYYAANVNTPNALPEFMFIPSSADDQDYVVTIDYDFITTDAAVQGGTVTVHNVIHRTLEDLEFQRGKKMKLYIGLGMTTVLFNAVVDDWADATPVDLWLPDNLLANAFALTSNSVAWSLDDYGAGTKAATAIYTSTPDGTVTLVSAKDNSGADAAGKFIFDAAGKTLAITGMTTPNGPYTLVFNAAGDATHAPKNETLTVTINPAP